MSRLFALSLLLAAGPALSADQVPRLDIQSTCNAAVPLVQQDRNPRETCLKDETQAQGELERQWAGYTPALREKCLGEATVGSYPSYVELLTCLQIGSGTLQSQQSQPSGSYRRPGR